MDLAFARNASGSFDQAEVSVANGSKREKLHSLFNLLGIRFRVSDFVES